jgi:hypothetical protein
LAICPTAISPLNRHERKIQPEYVTVEVYDAA